MREYKVLICDYKARNGLGEIITTKYCNGLSEARAMCPVALSYSRNCKCWVGTDWAKGLEYAAIKTSVVLRKKW